MIYGAYILEVWCDSERARKCWTVARVKSTSRILAINKLKLAGWKIRTGENWHTFCPECLKLVTFGFNGRVSYHTEDPDREPKNLRSPYWLATHNGELYGYESS